MVLFRLLALLLLIGAAPITTFGQQPHAKRSLKELINTQEPGWDLVQGWIKEATNPVEVLPRDPARADSALVQVQVTTRSPMGAVVHESGGILVDHGWIRILGSGSERLGRSLMEWNRGKSFTQEGEPPSFLLIADDAVGGFFAVNAGALDSTGLGKVYYFGPDNLIWSSTGLGYSEFLTFCFSGDLALFYQGLRWTAWKEDVAALNGDQAFYCFPYLSTVEGKDINKVNRSAVPIQELWTMYHGNGR